MKNIRSYSAAKETIRLSRDSSVRDMFDRMRWTGASDSRWYQAREDAKYEMELGFRCEVERGGRE